MLKFLVIVLCFFVIWGFVGIKKVICILGCVVKLIVSFLLNVDKLLVNEVYLLLRRVIFKVGVRFCCIDVNCDVEGMLILE